MADEIKDNIADGDTWKRGLFMVLCAFFYGVAEVVLFAIVIFQFLLKLVTGETNERLLKLGQGLATYIYQIVQFLNFNSEHLPYPFNGWPRAEPKELKPNEPKPKEPKPKAPKPKEPKPKEPKPKEPKPKEPKPKEPKPN